MVDEPAEPSSPYMVIMMSLPNLTALSIYGHQDKTKPSIYGHQDEAAAPSCPYMIIMMRLRHLAVHIWSS